MTSRGTPHHLRIFLSSPGDVAAERQLVRDAIEGLRYEPLLRDRASLQIYAWEVPGAGTPMVAGSDPQDCIDRRLITPAECDLVIVILAGRMGTPLTRDGRRYRSGTDYEFQNAMAARETPDRPSPEVLVYRKTGLPDLDSSQADYLDHLSQRRSVDEFFREFQNPDGSLRSGYNAFGSIEEFANRIEIDLKILIDRLCRERDDRTVPAKSEPANEIRPSSPASSQPEPSPGDSVPLPRVTGQTVLTEPIASSDLETIDDPDLARQLQRRWVRELNVDYTWTNRSGLSFRLIPPGRTAIGADEEDRDADRGEFPSVRVSIRRPFWAAVFPLDHRFLREFLEAAGDVDDQSLRSDLRKLIRDRSFAKTSRDRKAPDDHPATDLNRSDADLICRFLAERDGVAYRLPTEAEWAYMARAGAVGSLPDSSVPSPGGTLSPDGDRENRWGLIDMLGNVEEWTASEYGRLSDGGCESASATASNFVTRGGSWRDPTEWLRFYRRRTRHHRRRLDSLGIRLVCDVT